MITTLKPYTAYKDSGVPWLGKVPVHWEVRRLKTAVDHINEQTSTKTDVDLYIALEHVESWTGRLLVPSGEAQFDSQVKRFRAGDVLFGKLRPYLAKVVRPKQSGVCVGEFFVLRARPVVAPHYLEVVLRSAPAIDFVNSSTYGAKMPRADWTFVGAMLFPLPPLPEQTAIVRFVDWAERRIRRVIRARKKRIKLLEEYKQALIHQAVTGKIDVQTGQPYPAYKPSGVEWLGEVPQHWEVRRVKSATHLIMGQSPPSDDCSAEPIGLPFLQGCAEFGDVHPRAKQFCRRPVKVSPVGAILVSVRAPVGRLNVADQEYGIGRGLCAVVPVESLLDKTFVRYALSGSMDGLAMSSTGSTYDAVSVSDVGSHCLPLPPLPEQTAIAAYLDAQTAKIDAATAAARREIELLREYRTRLIADVVTGKVDVREVAARLPEEPEIPEQEEPLTFDDEPADSEPEEVQHEESPDAEA